ncbi:hypothetical protein [Streptomyces sp. 769]|uniref:hypothetical protein n=1 Tax=Streptomyces sp. 769 TaxID=1262452 RepID=UPI00057D8C97|nr:hypothetical protein [Streptomyces sp. 769]AJC54460.1 hypothetical protein GZL_01864 [Streptomyces sp. 769]
MVLPALLGSTPKVVPLGEAVLAVLTELVDVTARHRVSVDLAGRISYDGSHVLISIGEIDQTLPEPDDEPACTWCTESPRMSASMRASMGAM